MAPLPAASATMAAAKALSWLSFSNMPAIAGLRSLTITF
jgi:hypothetical protein